MCVIILEIGDAKELCWKFYLSQAFSAFKTFANVHDFRLISKEGVNLWFIYIISQCGRNKDDSE